MAAAGVGLFIGMFISPRIGSIVERRKISKTYIGVSIILHGVLFAIAGYLPYFWVIVFLIFISRAIIGAEYAMQETIFQRSLPDHIRGRISTIDRGAEIVTFSLSSFLAGISLYVISPQMLMVLSGLLSASAGVVWFIRMRSREEVFED
jgi:MFS family permease